MILQRSFGFLPHSRLGHYNFAIPVHNRAKTLVQVCESMASPKTRKREVAALAEGMKDLKMTTGTIVTRNDEEQIDCDAGVIRVVPA